MGAQAHTADAPGGAGPSDTPLVELGRALGDRSLDVAASIAARWEHKQGFAGTEPEFALRAEIKKITEMATDAVARYLVTGQSPTGEQAAAVSQTGRAPVDERLSLAGLTKLYLYWRDAAVLAVHAEAARLGSPDDAVETALAVVRAGADGSMVGMAKQFDVAYGQLRSQLAEEQARLAHLALHDGLTGLPNRALFLEQLTRALHSSGRRLARVAVLFVDIDHFKSVNDLAGHSTGDLLLTTVAERLVEAIRPGDTAARLGGDEFVVLCEDVRGGLEEAETVASRIGASLAAPFDAGGRALTVTASIGVAVAEVGDDPEVVLSHADGAMYVAKQRGRARYEVYRPAD